MSLIVRAKVASFRLYPSSNIRLVSMVNRMFTYQNSNSNIHQQPILSTDIHRISDETMENQKKAMNLTKLGAIANFGLAVSKFGAGYFAASTALLADSVNSLSDLLSDFVVYVTITEARKAATPDRPWGMGKLEPLGALIVSGLLLGTGLGIGHSTFYALLSSLQDDIVIQSVTPSIANHYIQFPEPPVLSTNIFPLDSKPMSDNLAHYLALGISTISILTKEFLFHKTLKAGLEANSSAVIANAYQHRSDSLISIGVFIGLCGARLGYLWMDPLMALAVSAGKSKIKYRLFIFIYNIVVIVKQAFVTGRESLKDLMDTPTSPEETQKLRETCLKVKGIQSVISMLARRSGPYLFVECVVGVDGNLSASAAHRLAELARISLLQKHNGRVAKAVVHVYPVGSAGMGDSVPVSER